MIEKEEEIKGYISRIIQTAPEFSETKIKTRDQKSYLQSRAYWLVLDKYLRAFFEKNLKQRIIVIPGLRGIGKTTLLYQAYNFLLNTKQIPKERLLYIDTSELKNTVGSNLNDLMKVYEEFFLQQPIEKLKDPLFIFIDEAHYDPNWASIVQTLFNRSDNFQNILIFVSGSSALALNINTDLSRRVIKDPLYPLSFQEYLKIKKSFYPPTQTAARIKTALNSDIESAHYILSTVYNELQNNLLKKSIDINRELLEFLSLGASPISLDIKSADLSFKSWIEIMDKVTKQDVPSFSKIGFKSSSTLFSLLRFIAESTPSIQSYGSIASKLNGVSDVHVINMFEALKNACLLFEIKQDVDSLRKTTKSSKYYFMHPTLRAALLWNIGRFRSDISLNDSQVLGILFEEAIAATLFRNKELKGGYITDVFFDAKECGADFIIKTPSGNVAIECGWGKKDNCQPLESMKRFKCKFGIKISKTNTLSMNENVITLPRELLLFI